MTSIQNNKGIRINIRSKPVAKKDYYDIIAGLSAFEKSQDVVLTKQELIELTKGQNEEIDGGKNIEINNKDEIKDSSDSSNSNQEIVTKQSMKRRQRPNLHGYLGGKVDMEKIKTAQHDLSHTLLGSYIPKRQLESLTSLDFAQYFHKALECEESLQIYDLFIQPTQVIKGRSMISKNSSSTSSSNTPPGSSSENSDPMDPKHNPRVYQWTKPDGKVIRKVVICNRCNSRFFGPNRMKQLAQHSCKITK